MERESAKQSPLVLGQVIGRGATGNVHIAEYAHKQVRKHTQREGREGEGERKRHCERETEG